MKVEISNKIECKRCGYQWQPRKADVVQCPRCHSPFWYRGRIYKRRKKKQQVI